MHKGIPYKEKSWTGSQTLKHFNFFSRSIVVRLGRAMSCSTNIPARFHTYAAPPLYNPFFFTPFRQLYKPSKEVYLLLKSKSSYCVLFYFAHTRDCQIPRTIYYTSCQNYYIVFGHNVLVYILTATFSQEYSNSLPQALKTTLSKPKYTSKYYFFGVKTQWAQYFTSIYSGRSDR